MSPHQSFFKADMRPAALERADRRRAVTASERREKALVRQRDGRCRWPRCWCAIYPTQWMYRREVAHLKAKGMGGDHGRRSTADQMILLCYDKHQGIVSLHSGDRQIMPLTNAGTNGPCAFKVKQGGRWRTIAAEREVGVLR